MNFDQSKFDEKKFRFDCARWDCRYEKRHEVMKDAWLWLSRAGFYPPESPWPKATRKNTQ